jgi:hypothetical protein
VSTPRTPSGSVDAAAYRGSGGAQGEADGLERRGRSGLKRVLAQGRPEAPVAVQVLDDHECDPLAARLLETGVNQLELTAEGVEHGSGDGFER